MDSVIIDEDFTLNVVEANDSESETEPSLDIERVPHFPSHVSVKQEVDIDDEYLSLEPFVDFLVAIKEEIKQEIDTKVERDQIQQSENVNECGKSANVEQKQKDIVKASTKPLQRDFKYDRGRLHRGNSSFVPRRKFRREKSWRPWRKFNNYRPRKFFNSNQICNSQLDNLWQTYNLVLNLIISLQQQAYQTPFWHTQTNAFALFFQTFAQLNGFGAQPHYFR